MARWNRSSFQCRRRSWSDRDLVGGRDDVQAGLIEHDGVGLDATPCRRAAGRLILHFHDAMFQDRPVQCLEHALLGRVRLGRHSQHVQDAAVLFVVIGHRRGQFVAHLVPERLDALPERRAEQWIQQIASQRERHQFRGGGRDLVRALCARAQFPDFAAWRGVRGHVEAGRLQRLQVAPHAARVQRSQSQVGDQFVADFLQRATEADSPPGSAGSCAGE